MPVGEVGLEGGAVDDRLAGLEIAAGEPAPELVDGWVEDVQFDAGAGRAAEEPVKLSV